MKHNAKVVAADQVNSPSYVLVTCETNIWVQGSGRTLRQQFLIHASDYPNPDLWPPKPGDMIPVELDLGAVIRT